MKGRVQEDGRGVRLHARGQRAGRVRGSNRRRVSTTVVVLGLVLGSTAGFARGADGACDGLFPDFRCDREGRPAGHIEPMSAPYLFEDPYITTSVNFVGIYHDFPSDSIFDGGEAGVLALQARLALTDRLAFIATKDGYTFLRPDNPLLENDEGFMDVTVGFKYAAYDDRESGWIVTPSLRYEIPLGTDDLYQGRGSGVFIPAVSVGWGPERVHVIADLGAQLPVDGDNDSTSIFYNLHLDEAFRIDCLPGADFFVPFIELNGIAWVDSGDGNGTIETSVGRLRLRTAQEVLHNSFGATSRLRGEGADIANLGSSGMAGEHLITMAWGFRVPFRNGVSLGFAYERVLSQREDIFEQRAMWMASYTF